MSLLLKGILKNNLKTEKYNYCSILQSYCYMMQKHHLDVQISVQFIQVYPHHRELCLRALGILKPLHPFPSPTLPKAILCDKVIPIWIPLL